MDLEQLSELPGTVYESNRQQAFRPTVLLSISNKERIFREFSTPGNNGRDESGVEGVRRLGGSAGGTDVTATDQIAIG